MWRLVRIIRLAVGRRDPFQAKQPSLVARKGLHVNSETKIVRLYSLVALSIEKQDLNYPWMKEMKEEEVEL